MAMKFYEDEDLMTKEELEAAQLQEDYRNLQIKMMQCENDHEKYSRIASKSLQKQEFELELLQAERTDLQTDISNADSKRNKYRKTACISEIGGRLSAIDEKKSEKDMENDKLKELAEEIRLYERKIEDKNKEMGGILSLNIYSKKMKHQSKVLENRLELSNRRLNTQIVANGKLRHEIDVFRNDRRRNDEILANLERQLDSIHKSRKHLVEETKQHHAIRDEAQQKMFSLRDKSKKEKSVAEEEMKELRRILDHDIRMKEFMEIKDKERQQVEQQTIWKKKIADARFAKTGDPEAKRKAEMDEGFEKVKKLRPGMQLDLIVAKFIEDEDENFALFNLVNSLNNQQEIFNEDIESIKVKLRDYEVELESRDAENHKKLEELDVKLTVLTKDKDFVIQKDRVVLKQLDQACKTIDKMFGVIECNQDEMNAMLGANEGVGFHNVLLYLCAIEGRSQELISNQTVVALNAGTLRIARSKLSPDTGRRRSTISTALINKAAFGGVILPELSEEVNLDNYSSKPLAREEMESKVKDAIIRRNQRREEAIETANALTGLHNPAASQSTKKISFKPKVTVAVEQS